MKRPDNIYKDEEWRQSPLLPDHFLVSDKGRCINTHTNHILKCVTDKRGYKIISYTENGYDKKVKLHRAIATAFIDNNDPDTDNVINHIDGNKTNNNVENLEWTTIRENTCYSPRY